MSKMQVMTEFAGGGVPENNTPARFLVGFTLAEILITLGIIGIVAAMTLPSLIQQYKKNKITVSLKKMYTTLIQAANTYQAQHEVYITDFDTSLPAKEFMERYFNPYLNILTVCGNSGKCWRGKRQPKALDGTKNIDFEYGVILVDGSILAVHSRADTIQFIFDADGIGGFNRSGHDIFYFYLVSPSAFLNVTPGGACNRALSIQPGIYPGGFSSCYVPFTEYSRKEIMGTNLHRACNKNASAIGSSEGDACAALIMMDGWEMKKDYPAW